MRTDVLVIGAGPAGAVAARALAQAGAAVVLADRQGFPRDKACGDALIPDALDVLRRVGLLPRVLARARRLEALDVHAPGGRRVRLSGGAACLPRAALDDELRRAAEEAGARFLPRHVLLAPLEEGGRVAGARFRELRGGGAVEVAADHTLLATGAAAGPLQSFGVCERASPSAMAARAYVRVDPALAREIDALAISYDRAVCPGYGWVFPGPEGLVNLGVGWFEDGPAPPTRNLAHLLERFVATFPLAGRVWRHGKAVGPLRGAPLRTALRGARLHRPGLLVTGEAAGLTYSFSGEGIGKAMDGALLAAEAVIAAREGDPGPRYERALRARHGARFRAYELAQRRLSSPRLADLLAARARPGSYAQRQLEALFNETSEPRALFSPWGLLRALVG